MKESMVKQLTDIIPRDMDLQDVEEVARIENMSFRSPWPRYAFVLELVSNPHAKYRVLTMDSGIVAYGGMWLHIDEAHVTNIAVHPAYRGRGLGEAMLKDLMHCVRKLNINNMTLEVRITNQAAIKLYQKHGFKELSIRKGYYKDTGEDGIVMNCEL